jgi:hypothetical protein
LSIYDGGGAASFIGTLHHTIDEHTDNGCIDIFFDRVIYGIVEYPFADQL